MQAVLERTLSDEGFRAQLLSAPDEALAEYELTDEEQKALRSLSLEAEASGSALLDQRASKRALWLEF